MPTVRELVQAMDAIAPPHFAESWDNVGLLVGDPGASFSRAMLAIDYTSNVANEAKAQRCEAVIAYHPTIFSGLKQLTAGGVVYDAIQNGIAIYSPHTALDVATGGTNDVLADILELKDRRPLRPIAAAATSVSAFKLVTFIPKADIEPVAAALYAAGAGRIGNYSECSFRSEGVGTFLGDKGTSPTIGKPGQLERVEEVRFETIVVDNRITTVIEALKRSHPYEEPAFDIFAEAAVASPDSNVGIGRVGKLPGDATGDMIINRLKRELSLDHLLVAGDVTRLIKTMAVCAGAGGELLDHAIAANADLYLTGELRHHDVLKAVARGMLVICTLHSNSERIALKSVAERLAAAIPSATFHLSQSDRDPLSVM